MARKNEAKKLKKQQMQVKNEKAKNTQRLMGWTLAVIFVICVGLIIVKAVSGPKATETIPAETFQYEKQPVLGSQDAPVKIVEFADFKCPSCKQFNDTILTQLKKDFVDNGTVQLYFMNYPVISPNEDSRTAALAAEAVYRQSPEEFWKFYSAVYAQQKDERTTWATSDFLVDIAKQADLKLDFDQLKKDIDNEAFAQDVNDDEAIANQIGVNGTPTIYVNGKVVAVQDTFNYESLKKIIQEASVGSGNEAP